MTPESTPRLHSPLKGTLYILVGRLLIGLGILIWLTLFFVRADNAHGRAVSPWPGLIPTLILYGIGHVGLLCIRRGKKLRVLPGELLLQQDTRAPVIYLRSFSADGSETGTDPNERLGLFLEKPTDEEDLAKVFAAVGPFVAIGKPSEKLPELGASRLYIDNNDWQRVVTDLVRRAKLVILRIGTSDGLLWEIENVVKNCSPEAVLLYLPWRPERRKHKGKANRKPDFYDAFRQFANPRLPHPLPEEIGSARFISFRQGWIPEYAQPLGYFQQGYSMTASEARNMRIELKAVFKRLDVKLPATPSSFVLGLFLVLFAIALIILIAFA